MSCNASNSEAIFFVHSIFHLFFVPSQTFMGVRQLIIWKPVLLKGEKFQGKLEGIQILGVFALSFFKDTNDRQSHLLSIDVQLCKN